MVTFDPYWSPPPQHERAPLNAEQSRSRIFPNWVPGRIPIESEAARLNAGDLNNFHIWVRLGPTLLGVLNELGNFHLVDLATQRILGSAAFGQNEGVFDDAVMTPDGFLVVLLLAEAGGDSLLWFDPWQVGPVQLPREIDIPWTTQNPLAEYVAHDYISRLTAWKSGIAALLHGQTVLRWRYSRPVHTPKEFPIWQRCEPAWSADFNPDADVEVVEAVEDGPHIHSIVIFGNQEELFYLYTNAETGEMACNPIDSIESIPRFIIGASANWMLFHDQGDIWAMDGLDREEPRKLSLPAIFGIGTRTLEGTWKGRGKWIVGATSNSNNSDYGESILAIWDLTKDTTPLVVPTQTTLRYPVVEFIGEDWVLVRNAFTQPSSVELFDLESGQILYSG